MSAVSTVAAGAESAVKAVTDTVVRPAIDAVTGR
jgi:hypothetical protein